MVTTSTRNGVEWEGTALPEAPSAPETLQEAGLNLPFLNELLLRTLYTRGVLLGLDLARLVCLPFKVIEESLRFLKDDKLIEVNGGDLIGRVSYKFNLTDIGRRRAQEAMKHCSYVGPAPVPLEDYIEQTYRQAVTGITCSPEPLRASFSHLVIPDELFNAVGPAIDAVSEVTVQTNGYNAEYGRAAGGVINVTLKSGTNTLHGSVFEYLQNRDLDANSWSNNRAGQPIGPFVQNQFGATAGGPIKRNRLFLFGDYQGTRIAD